LHRGDRACSVPGRRAARPGALRVPALAERVTSGRGYQPAGTGLTPGPTSKTPEEMTRPG